MGGHCYVAGICWLINWHVTSPTQRKLGNRDCLGKPWVPYPHAELSTSRLNAIADKYNLPKYPPESLEKQIERINELKRAEKGAAA